MWTGDNKEKLIQYSDTTVKKSYVWNILLRTALTVVENISVKTQFQKKRQLL